MTRELKLTIDEFISVNHYLSYRTIKRGNKYMAMSYKTKEAKDFQKKFIKYVKDQVKLQGWDVPVNNTQHFIVEATYYFPRVDMDSNNYWKVGLDAITDANCIWEDDNVVCERCKRIYYDNKNPRIEWTIKPVSYIGIFNDEEQLNMFENKCKACNRYGRNCSILRKAKEGRIQEELNELVCIKWTNKK